MSTPEPISQPEVTPTKDTPEEVYLDENGEPMTKSAIKKMKKMQEAQRKREQKRIEHEAHLAAQKAEKASREQDSLVTLTKPDTAFTEIAIPDAQSSVGQRIRIRGWVALVRRQAKLIFIELRDGTGFDNLQCVFEGDVANTAGAKLLTKESAVDLYGELVALTIDDKNKYPYELRVDYWEMVHSSSPDLLNMYNAKTKSDVLLDLRHLVLRERKESCTLEVSSEVAYQFRSFLRSKRFTEVFPPTIVQNQVEGGSTLFKLDYFDQKAYLTQSSQLYLEAAAPAVRHTYCLVPSYRAENSHTRRHLATFMHFEAELSFISFDDLLDCIESLVVHTVTTLYNDPHFGRIIREFNPTFTLPQTPFMRMDYRDAIQWLNTHEIKKEDGTDYVFGDDIPEAPERHMTDTIGRPIFLCRFPTEMKPFYMYRDPSDPKVTESVDLLMPGVGEIVGGSMRIWDEQELMEGFKREGLNPDEYKWYTDLRRYGSCPHGGFGLGFERFICWMLGLYNIREATLFPRTADRCTP